MRRAGKRSLRGVWLVLGMFVLGGAVLGGLFLAPRPASPPAPPTIAWGAPGRPPRFVSYNVLHTGAACRALFEQINKLQPDFVFLQEVESEHVLEMAKQLGLAKTYQPTMYFPSVNLAGPGASWGNVIFSKHPIYEAGTIPNPGGGSFGVWAVAVVDGKKFVIADVHLSATWNAKPSHLKDSGENRYKELTNLRQAWHDRGSPPIVIAGDFNQLAAGNNYELMTREWTDAMEKLGHTGITFGEGVIRTRIDYFLISKEWRAVDGGIGPSGPSDHRPIWLDTAAVVARVAATQP